MGQNTLDWRREEMPLRDWRREEVPLRDWRGEEVPLRDWRREEVPLRLHILRHLIVCLFSMTSANPRSILKYSE